MNIANKGSIAPITRRLLLRRASGAALATPLLLPNKSFAAEVPRRVITVFFGQGLPEEWYPTQSGGNVPAYSGTMAPWNRFADRFSVVPVDHVSSSGDPHDVGPQSAFTGYGLRGAGPGGPTLDQVVRETLHPGGAPTPFQTMSMGTFHREGGFIRHVHSWGSDLSPAAIPIEDPATLFDRLFANTDLPSNTADEATLRAERLKRSVLDSVLDSYRHYQGERSPLGMEQRTQLGNHLDRLRQLEQRVFKAVEQNCAKPDKPGATGADSLRKNQRQGGGGGGTDVVASEWVATWQALVDIYVAALECDLFRFGNVIFQSGGDRVRISGDYRENNQLIERFDDQETSHEYYHRWRGSGAAKARSHTRFIMGNLAYFFEAMNRARDESGNSMLDSTSMIVTTELSDPDAHSYRRVFHAINSSGGEIKTGQIFNAGRAKNLDLYNTYLKAMQVNKRMGGNNYQPDYIDSVIN